MIAPSLSGGIPRHPATGGGRGRRALFPRLALLAALGMTLAAPRAPAQAINAGEAEAQKCEEKIAAVHRDVLGRYEDALQELQAGFQKAADLEGALAVRGERQRLAKDGALTERDFVAEPKGLRAAQVSAVAKLRELTGQLVQETVPRLVEYKRSLTVAGKLDEAVAVRAAIERLQGNYVPIVRPDAASVTAAETILGAFAADRGRAEKTFKGQRVTVRGILGGYRTDAADPKSYLLFLAGTGAGTGWVQCAFPLADFRFREERQFNTTILVISPKENDAATVRVQKGQALEMRGTCEGWDEMVRMVKCDLGR